ncbi:MAG: hypothetical protein AAFU80_21435 [Pseudomonadota bacterium]
MPLLLGIIHIFGGFALVAAVLPRMLPDLVLVSGTGLHTVIAVEWWAVACAGALYLVAIVLSFRRPGFMAAVLGIFAATSMTLASHRVIVDGASGTVSDVWLMLPVQQIMVPTTDGAHVRLAGGGHWATLEVAGEDRVIFAGIAPWKLDLSPLAELIT